MQILHLSADYPDPLQPAKTRAVANLLELVPVHDHRVYSLNRVGWRAGIRALPFADAAGADHRALAYGAPGRGLFLIRYLDRLAGWILADLAARGVRPDLVHAHKLTIEGIAGQRIAAALGIPLILSVQGNTDLKIARARPDLRPRYRAIWHGASAAFPFAPWAAAGLDALLGPRTRPVRMLPCPGPAEARLAPQVTPEGAPAIIRTAFHFRDWRNKNAAGLIRAVGMAARSVPQIRLEIIGGGDAAGFAALAALAEAVAPGRVTFAGPIPNAAMQERLNASTAFALLSRRESFGMVFAEALGAGVPCLYSRGRAIEGYFEDGSVVLAADPGDEAGIAAALIRLVREEAAFKSRLAALMAEGGLDFLTRTAIAARYREGLEAARGAAGPAADAPSRAGSAGPGEV